MMFKTHIGATEDATSVSYLRPETAGGMFVNFKNIVDSFHPKLPFGIAQIGKAFRNEIAPRDFTFRAREFEQMEIEYFVDPREPGKVNEIFDALFDEQMKFLESIGLSKDKLHKIEVPDGDRAHYSKRSVDTEYDFPFGQKELLGLAYRTDFDLKAHSEKSTVDLAFFDEATKERFTPHCIEPTFGVDRLILAVLSSAYTEDQLGGEVRTYLRLPKEIAPVKAAVFPLLKNKPELVAKARDVYAILKKQIPNIISETTGRIGTLAEIIFVRCLLGGQVWELLGTNETLTGTRFAGPGC
jgi:glycyl-tRNA synthetase